MSLSSLQALADNRKELLLAEVAALLHNIGKFSEEFLKYEAREAGWEKYDYQAIAGLVSLLAPTTLTKQEKQRLQSAIDSNGEAKTSSLLSGTQKAWLQKRDLKLPKPFDDHVYALGDWIEFQDFGWYKTTKGGSPPRITLLFPSGSHATELLEASHHVASGIEKEGTPKDEGRQTQFPMYIATAFGWESQIEKDKLGQWRNDLLDSLPVQSRHSPAWSYLEKAVGDTRRPINEVRLSDLSFSVAALFKSAAAQAVISGNWTPRDHLRWRVLRVNFDVLALYAKAVKISDLLAYQRAVEDACGAVKRLVEEEYPLGNEIYRDTSGIYFTFPDLDLPADLKQEIRRRVEEVEMELAPRIAVTVGDGNTAQDQLKGILAKARGEAKAALAQPFDDDNRSALEKIERAWQTAQQNLDKKWELCPVCRLRPMHEGAEACEHCLKRRGSRIAEWLDHPQRTIWLDELADHNGRVALLVGKFGLDGWLSGDLAQTMLVKAEKNNPAGCTPKNPSPARLRRVWETCRRFWTDTVQGLLDALPARERFLLQVEETSKLPPKAVVCDGTLNGQPISVWRMDDMLLTISFVSEKPKAGRLNLSWEYNGRKGQAVYRVTNAKEASADYACYYPTLTLLASPDQFLALVPAADALEIAEQIRNEYRRQFGKVQNRLPLFLGLVFFPRKMPLLAVMDTARRMLNAPLEDGEWTVRSVQAETEQWKINGNPVDQVICALGLTQDGQEITLRVPTRMGDGQTEDLWYPYFFVPGTPQCKHRFQLRKEGDTDPQKVGSVSERYADRWLVHVNELKEGDMVSITPSRFAYLFLDSTARRFHFDPEKDALLLGELPYLREMWKKICAIPEMTDTKLRGVQALLESKAAMWGMADDAFQNLTQTTLQRAGMLGAVSPEDVTSGRFARCLDLHMKILKLRLKETQNERQPETTTA